MAKDYELRQARDLGERLGKLGNGIDSTRDFDSDPELRAVKEEGYVSGIDVYILSQFSRGNNFRGWLDGIAQSQSLEDSFRENRDEYINPRDLFQGAKVQDYRRGFESALTINRPEGDSEIYLRGRQDAIRLILSSFKLEGDISKLMETPEAFLSFMYGVKIGFKGLATLDQDGKPAVSYDRSYEQTTNDQTMKLEGIRVGYQLRQRQS